MTNRSRTLYTGMTSELYVRVKQHKIGTFKGFTSKYKLDRLAYYQEFVLVNNAIRREKQIKGWNRIKKIELIVTQNPKWNDLAED